MRPTKATLKARAWAALAKEAIARRAPEASQLAPGDLWDAVPAARADGLDRAEVIRGALIEAYRMGVAAEAEHRTSLVNAALLGARARFERLAATLAKSITEHPSEKTTR